MKEARDTRPFHIQLREKKLRGTTNLTPVGTEKKQSRFRVPAPEPTEDKEEVEKEPKPKKVPTAPSGKKNKKKMKQRSKKGAKTMRDLKLNYGPYLEKHPVCEVQEIGCTHFATCVHHVEGRGITVVLDQKKWKACCHNCNDMVEKKDAKARLEGNKTSRLGKPKKFTDNGL